MNSCKHEGMTRLTTFEGEENTVCCDCGAEIYRWTYGPK